MPTHAIGTGTRNLSVNVPTDERALWGQIAFHFVQSGEAKSTGDFIRRVLLRGLEATDKKSAAKLKEIRIRYYAGTLLLLLCASLLLSWVSPTAAAPTLRARAQRVGVRSPGRSRAEEEAAI
jgi:hypothetical protein